MSTSFMTNLRLYIASGAGVTAVRTRDPVASVSHTVAMCAAQNRPVRIWDPARGWLAESDPVMSAGDGIIDPIRALQAVLTPDTANGKMPNNGVFVLTTLHPFIDKTKPNPMLLQLLMIMAHKLPRDLRRVVITIPPGYQFPNELIELIPIVDHEAPTVEGLSELARNALDDFKATSREFMPRNMSDADMQRLAQAGVGMIEPEFEGALARVVMDATTKRTPLTPEDMRRRMLREKAEMVKRNAALEVLDPVSLEQVGGLDLLKEWMQTRVNAMDPKAWEAGVDKPKGAAFVGPPGTGKSLCAKVIGSVLGVATISFNISAVFQGLVGSSEENMRAALFMIKSLAPCVVLLDEIDKVFHTGPSGDSGVSQKVLGTLLTFMQENDRAIFWVPTMNRTEAIPAEFLRAGRLDNVFGVTTPNVRERADILRIHMRKRKIDPDTIAPDDLMVVARACEGFVGAEIEDVTKIARLAAYNAGEDVTASHLMRATQDIRPLSKKMAEQFAAMKDWCERNAAPASSAYSDTIPVPEAGAGRSRTRRIVSGGGMVN